MVWIVGGMCEDGGVDGFVIDFVGCCLFVGGVYS